MKNRLLLTILLGLTLLLAGCQDPSLFVHRGKPFTQPLQKIAEVDRNYERLIFKKTTVRIQGKIKYQCKIKGAWAFIEDDSGLIFVNFAEATPNMYIPTRQYKNPISVEGILNIDDTVINNYRLIPSGYEYLPLTQQ